MTLYRGYDRTALDAQYNNRGLVPDYAQYLTRWTDDSAALRARLTAQGAGQGTGQGTAQGAKIDLAYGESGKEKLDVFPAPPGPGGKKPPVLAFLHGGYWRLLDKSDFSYPAQAYVSAGITYVSVNYGLTPAVTLDEIVRQSRAALAWLYRNSNIHGGDPDRLYVSGHSAGGQLAPIVLGTDWASQGLPGKMVKGAVAISGIYDLEPMRLSYLNEGMNLDAASVERNSPIRQVPPRTRRVGPLVLCVGGDESPEFLRQQADYAAVWAKSQAPARIVGAAGRNHFSVMDWMGEAGSPLFRACRDLALG